MSVTWPLATHAQQAGKLPTIGLLGTGSQAAWARWTEAFVRRMRDLGWVEGRTVAIEYRWAEGRPDRHAEIAGEFVRMKVDVIVTSGTAGLATKQATSTIPIVFTIFGDPIGSGLVASLARPGGNITGMSTQTDDLAGKRLGTASYARSFQISAASQSCWMLVSRRRWWRRASLRPRRERSGWTSSSLEFGSRRIFRARSTN
jgi:hypothetical protein